MLFLEQDDDREAGCYRGDQRIIFPTFPALNLNVKQILAASEEIDLAAGTIANNTDSDETPYQERWTIEPYYLRRLFRLLLTLQKHTVIYV